MKRIRGRPRAVGFVSLCAALALLAATAPAAGQEMTASPTETPQPMLVIDALDTDVGYVDITGLGVARESDSLVLTMRLAEPVPVDLPSARESVEYRFVLHGDVSPDDGFGWWVSAENAEGGDLVGVLADMDARTTVEPFPGEVITDGAILTIVLPMSAVGDPASVELCAMARSADPDGATRAQDTAPDQASGDCSPPPLIDRFPTPRPFFDG